MPSSTFNWYTTTGMLAASALVSGVVGPGLAGASFFEASFLSSASLPWLAGCGALVGLGSGMGKGCTSGNGIQGLACCSKASLAFVMIFMAGSGVAAALVDQSAALAPVPSVFSTNLALVQLGLLVVQGAFGWMATEMEPTDRLLPVSNVAAGAGFAVSLVQASMVKPSKVLGFLNFAGPLGWDPSLAFVMGGGVLVALPLFQLGGLVKSGSAELQAFARPPDRRGHRRRRRPLRRRLGAQRALPGPRHRRRRRRLAWLGGVDVLDVRRARGGEPRGGGEGGREGEVRRKGLGAICNLRSTGIPVVARDRVRHQRGHPRIAEHRLLRARENVANSPRTLEREKRKPHGQSSTARARAGAGKYLCVLRLHGFAASRTRNAAVPSAAPPAAARARASESGVGPPGSAAAWMSAPARSSASARSGVRNSRWWSGVDQRRVRTSQAAMSGWPRWVAMCSAVSFGASKGKVRLAP